MLNGVGQVQARHRTDCRCSGVQDRDEQQSPASRGTCVAHFRHREEPDDYVWQTGRTQHQRQRVHHHIKGTAFLGRVFGKAKIDKRLIKFQQQWCAVCGVTDQAQLRERVSGQVQ